jgi:hypothetical protein
VISPSVTQKYFPSPFSLLSWHIDWIEGFFLGGGQYGNLNSGLCACYNYSATWAKSPSFF